MASSALPITSDFAATRTIHIGVIIPVRNRRPITQAILTQLSQQIETQAGKHTLEVIVVDDDSNDGTAAMIEQEFPQVHLLKGNGNLWWTGAIALGMTYAIDHLQVHEIVWLNDDITLADDLITQLIWQSQRTWHRKIITGGIICDRNHPHWVVFGGIKASQPITSLQAFDQTPVLNVDALNGNLVLMSTQVIKDIGLPDTKRFLHYGGDYEYICRAKAAGYQVQLSSLLKAQTDYQLKDILRYSPLWIQWYFSTNWAEKKAVLGNLRDRKSPHNVEHMVNSIYRQLNSVPQWRYTWFYLKKLIKIIGSEFVPRTIRKRHAEAYFQKLNIPADITQLVLK
jgi:glycosyltransferase involved in cell wall biosynthesis